MVTEYGQLSETDLQRYRTHRARSLGIAIASQYYTREEIEQNIRDQFQLWAEFIERYDLPPTEDELVIDPNSGKCYAATP